ncbi:MAG: molecular chaperone HtpG, partial [Sandaracinaceae bacterium]|nr:molecular chaperone HtpG [Sandaracinaceae bacterium]
MTDADRTTHRFEAEVDQVLRLVIHSLYSNREIFLRELISNASDALDKLRFRAVTEPALVPEGTSLEIRISTDPEARTLTIWDSGVGMTRQELIEHLGTVAKSGSRELAAKLAEAKQGELSLIGQFGVGFYSAWLVADHVDVISRAAGSSEAHKWSSEAKGTFTVEPAEREVAGTSVVLHLTEEHAHLLEEHELGRLVERYSDYIGWPIKLARDGEWRSLNRASALWQRPKSEIAKEQYEDLYRHVSRDWEPPLAWRHFKIEGTQEFAGVVFVPRRAGLELYTPDAKHGIRLYVKRVFIMDDAEQLVPRFLRFIRGVVDSEDLPLNVSRELLQDSSVVRVIRKQIAKQMLDLLAEMAKDREEDYALFWRSFGPVLKEGLHSDPEHKASLLPLLRFESTAGPGLVSLDAYRGRMKEGQKAIYYVIGESRRQLESSPHIEGLRKRGLEVLLLTDPVDPFALPALREIEGVPLVSATESGLDLGEQEKLDETKTEGLEPLRSRFRVRLQDRVTDVRLSTRLTDSPACLVLAEGSLPPHIERILRATQRDVPAQKRILELNPTHAVITNLARALAAGAGG